MKSLPAASRSKREQRALGASQLGSRMSSEREPHTRGTRRPPPEPPSLPPPPPPRSALEIGGVEGEEACAGEGEQRSGMGWRQQTRPAEEDNASKRGHSIGVKALRAQFFFPLD